jgi:hypothetical protein
MTIEEGLRVVFTSVGGVLAVGGSATAISYAVFRTLGKRWLDQHFAKQLERLKHDHQTELELLRHEISSLYSRISRVHEKEFEILPKAWYLLHVGYGKASSVISPLKESPDLNRMSAPQFEEWLATCRLPAQFQKDELREAKDRTKHYQQTIYWVDLAEADAAQTAFNNYLVENSIFMTDDLRQKFREINTALKKALSGQEIGTRYQSPDVLKSSSETFVPLYDMFSQIESAVQKRLRYEEA